QVEKTVRELRDRPFVEIRTIETLEREMVVGEMGTRPSFKMLGHTGYLTFARKVETPFRYRRAQP
ncbi:MAG: tRNA methyltransferase, partial [Thermoplasmata archaeon]|nr:tRNA methyltransferase [Thermoplasmata archaeon]